MQSAAAAALSLTVYIPNELCSQFAPEPLVLRVCLPEAHRSSTWASGVYILDKSSSVMSDPFLPSSSSQSEYLHWDLLFLWDKKLFHARKTWGEKPLNALERKTSQDKGRSDSGKLRSCKEHKYLSHGVISWRVCPCQTDGVQAAGWMHPQRPKASFPRSSMDLLIHFSAACNTAHQNSPGRGMNFPSAFISQWATETPPLPRNAGDPFTKKLQVFVPVKSSASSSTEFQL